MKVNVSDPRINFHFSSYNASDSFSTQQDRQLIESLAKIIRTYNTKEIQSEKSTNTDHKLDDKKSKDESIVADNNDKMKCGFNQMSLNMQGKVKVETPSTIYQAKSTGENMLKHFILSSKIQDFSTVLFPRMSTSAKFFQNNAVEVCDYRKHYFSCIDGRIDEGILGTPGGITIIILNGK